MSFDILLGGVSVLMELIRLKTWTFQLQKLMYA